MMKKVKDLTFSLMLIFVVAIGIYWLMVELQKDYLDHYLSLLGEKLIELVPESSEKRSLKTFFDDFKTQVENQEVTPEQVEKVAAGILNISNLKDSISVAEARAVIEMAKYVRIPDDRTERERLIMRPEQKNMRDPELRWKELGDRLESIYKLDQGMKHIPDSIKIIYRFDDRLNVIVDTHVKAIMEQKGHEQMIRQIRQLEKEKAIIWQENVSSQMEIIRVQLKELRKKHELTRVKDLEQIILFDPSYIVDSLSKVIAKINVDSITIIVEQEIKKQPVIKHAH